MILSFLILCILYVCFLLRFLGMKLFDITPSTLQKTFSEWEKQLFFDVVYFNDKRENNIQNISSKHFPVINSQKIKFKINFRGN